MVRSAATELKVACAGIAVVVWRLLVDLVQRRRGVVVPSSRRCCYLFEFFMPHISCVKVAIGVRLPAHCGCEICSCGVDPWWPCRWLGSCVGATKIHGPVLFVLSFEACKRLQECHREELAPA